MSDGLQGTLEGKEYRQLYMVFLFVTAFLDRCIWYGKEVMGLHIHCTHFWLKRSAWVQEICPGPKLSIKFWIAKWAPSRRLWRTQLPSILALGFSLWSSAFLTISSRIFLGFPRSLLYTLYYFNDIVCTLKYHIVKHWVARKWEWRRRLRDFHHVPKLRRLVGNLNRHTKA